METKRYLFRVSEPLASELYGATNEDIDLESTQGEPSVYLPWSKGAMMTSDDPEADLIFRVRDNFSQQKRCCTPWYLHPLRQLSTKTPAQLMHFVQYMVKKIRQLTSSPNDSSTSFSISSQDCRSICRRKKKGKVSPKRKVADRPEILRQRLNRGSVHTPFSDIIPFTIVWIREPMKRDERVLQEIKTIGLREGWRKKFHSVAGRS